MQLFMAEKNNIFKRKKKLPLKTWKNHPQKLLIIGSIFFSVLPTGPKPVQMSDIFPRNLLPRGFSIMTLVKSAILSNKHCD